MTERVDPAAARGPQARPGPAVALSVWCVVFAIPHLYWAGGGRAGLGGEAAAADAALATPWFALYNAVVVAMSLVGVWVGVEVARGRRRRWLRTVLIVAAVVLLGRGLLGTAELIVAAVGPGITSPPVLVAIEGWFVLGGLICASTARMIRP